MATLNTLTPADLQRLQALAPLVSPTQLAAIAQVMATLEVLGTTYTPPAKSVYAQIPAQTIKLGSSVWIPAQLQNAPGGIASFTFTGQCILFVTTPPTGILSINAYKILANGNLVLLTTWSWLPNTRLNINYYGRNPMSLTFAAGENMALAIGTAACNKANLVLPAPITLHVW
jgi:hypothetical protein